MSQLALGESGSTGEQGAQRVRLGKEDDFPGEERTLLRMALRFPQSCMEGFMEAFLYRTIL